VVSDAGGAPAPDKLPAGNRQTQDHLDDGDRAYAAARHEEAHVTRYAVLLRGINVGRAHRVPMAELRELLTAEGHTGVATLLQSGNVVLDSDRPAGELASSVEQALERRFGFAVPVVLRTRDELLAVLAGDPLGSVATDPSRYVVSFSAAPVPAEVRDRLAAVDPGDDVFTVDGRELYLWCPHGQLQSPLSAALAKLKGGPVGTARNWATVRKLGDLLQR
jgi:uncharacterized protein (DUF1697 family)